MQGNCFFVVCSKGIRRGHGSSDSTRSAKSLFTDPRPSDSDYSKAYINPNTMGNNDAEASVLVAAEEPSMAIE